MKSKAKRVETRELAEATLACIGDGVISTDLNKSILYMNETAEHILDISLEEAFQKDFDSVVKFFDADTKQRKTSPIIDVICNNEIKGLENNTVIYANDGALKYVSATFSNVKDIQYNNIGVVIILRDITRMKKLEIEHIDEKKNLKTIFDFAPVGMVTLDENYKIIQANDAFLQLIQNTREFVVGQHFGDGFGCSGSVNDNQGCGYGTHCSCCELNKAIRLAINKGKETSKFEVKKVLCIGEEEREYWLLTSVTPLMVNQKRKCIMTLTDITESKNKELLITKDFTELKCAQENLERYRKIIDNARDIIFLLDLDGRILEANNSAVDMYGYTMEELCNMNIRAIREDWGFAQSQMELADQGGIFFETFHKKKDGSSFQVEVSSQGMNIGNKQILFSIIRDITERKRAEKDIRINQGKYYHLFMNMKSAYAYFKLIYDENNKPIDMRLLDVNNAFKELFGTRKDVETGNYYTKLFRTMLNGIIVQHYNEIVVGRSIDIEEFYSPIYNKWLSVSIYSPYKNDVVTIISDITEMKQSELKLISTKEAAEAANRAKSEFLANMSHEIRTPINGMMGMVDLTLLTELTFEQQDNLKTAKNCANSLLNIINDILDFSKMEAGKLSIEAITFDVKELVEDLVKSYSPRVEEKKLDLMYSFSSSIPSYLIGDPNRLRQIINNLLSNAVKFTKEGNIFLSIKTVIKSEEQIVLEFQIKDTGIGLAPEDMGKLFQSFNQVEQSFTKKYGGTGLGLAISKQLVELMGGNISVNSQKGVGSTFYFNLPFLIGQALDMNTIQHTNNIINSYSKLNILLAEDDLTNQKVIMKMLMGRGYEVDLASNGLEALEFYHQKKYDIILMDIQMPEMNGVDVAQRIRQMEKDKKHTPIIAISAYALKGDKERFLSIGMDAYISKPIDMKDLYFTIERMISQIGIQETSIPDNIFVNDKGEVQFLMSNMETSNSNNVQLIEELLDKIELLDGAISKDNLMMIEEVAHSIKSISNELDFIELKELSFKIELAARRGNLVDAVKNINKIKGEFNTLQNKLYAVKEELV